LLGKVLPCYWFWRSVARQWSCVAVSCPCVRRWWGRGSLPALHVALAVWGVAFPLGFLSQVERRQPPCRGLGCCALYVPHLALQVHSVVFLTSLIHSVWYRLIDKSGALSVVSVRFSFGFQCVVSNLNSRGPHIHIRRMSACLEMDSRPFLSSFGLAHLFVSCYGLTVVCLIT